MVDPTKSKALITLLVPTPLQGLSSLFVLFIDYFIIIIIDQFLRFPQRVTNFPLSKMTLLSFGSLWEILLF